MEQNTEIASGNDPDDNSHPYVLRLFVKGASTNSLKAINNIKEVCEKYLSGNYSLEIIDVHQQKSIAEKENIIALPLLIKSFPYPERRMVGDMSDTPRVLKGLGISN
ncbi:circadian clock KaiB family protein [Dyadobacter sp. NIV53]|uniref:circadian clock KaiB family protein n=1 Tax=Dyadobacter sp. NIV53 TaxID=2861765 RepID=UPI001C87422A|nr:circadian clock KaiB family protein [Dyadobacter sp. NIV53]